MIRDGTLVDGFSVRLVELLGLEGCRFLRRACPMTEDQGRPMRLGLGVVRNLEARSVTRAVTTPTR